MKFPGWKQRLLDELSNGHCVTRANANIFISEVLGDPCLKVMFNAGLTPRQAALEEMETCARYANVKLRRDHATSQFG